MGIEVFKGIPKKSSVIVAVAVWQYSHHVFSGLNTHKGDILTIANWSGKWPGLVGLLNLNASLTKDGINYSTLWSEDFLDEKFTQNLKTWIEKGKIKHDESHVIPFKDITFSQPVKPKVATNKNTNHGIPLLKLCRMFCVCFIVFKFNSYFNEVWEAK